MSKLWVLSWANPEGMYDAYHGHVVIAESEAAARALAPTGDEGEGFWLDPAVSECVELDPSLETIPSVLLSAFHAG